MKRKSKQVESEDDLRALVYKHADRLGIEDKESAYQNALLFAKLVGTVENSGNLTGGNIPQAGKEASSAKGLYQFVNGSIGPAKKRLERAGLSISKINPNDMTWEEQTALFLADLLEKTAVVDGKKVPGLGDKFMRGVLDTASRDSMANAYLHLHHTNPEDEKTLKRTKEIFYGDIYENKPEQP